MTTPNNFYHPNQLSTRYVVVVLGVVVQTRWLNLTIRSYAHLRSKSEHLGVGLLLGAHFLIVRAQIENNRSYGGWRSAFIHSCQFKHCDTVP